MLISTVALYFCAADAVLITQVLYYNHVNSGKQTLQVSAQTDTEDRPDQPLLSRRPSDNIGLPGSRRRSSVSQNGQGAVIIPSIAEDGCYARSWLRNSLSVFAVCALGVVRTLLRLSCLFCVESEENIVFWGQKDNICLAVQPPKLTQIFV